MARPKKKESEKVVKIRISMDRSVHRNLKKKNIKISTYINQLLKVSLASSTNAHNNIAQANSMNSTTLAGGFYL